MRGHLQAVKLLPGQKQTAAYVRNAALLDSQGSSEGAVLFLVLQERLLVGVSLCLQLVLNLLKRCLCILEPWLPLLALDQQEPHIVLVLMKLQRGAERRDPMDLVAGKAHHGQYSGTSLCSAPSSPPQQCGFSVTALG